MNLRLWNAEVGWHGILHAFQFNMYKDSELFTKSIFHSNCLPKIVGRAPWMMGVHEGMDVQAVSFSGTGTSSRIVPTKEQVGGAVVPIFLNLSHAQLTFRPKFRSIWLLCRSRESGDKWSANFIIIRYLASNLLQSLSSYESPMIGFIIMEKLWKERRLIFRGGLRFGFANRITNWSGWKSETHRET